MAQPPETESSIEQLIVDFKTAASIPTKQRVLNISKLVDRICSNAYENGVSNTSLEELLDAVFLPNYLDQASIGRLIRSLYPVSKISDSVVIKVVGCLGHGRAKPSFTIQAALLKWLLMVYDFLENQRVLSRLYSVLFNLLDTIAISMELTRQAGNDPPLVGLMKVYKDYYPDIIVGEVTSGRASVFTHPNLEWCQRLGEIQDAYLQKTQEVRPSEQKKFRVARQGVNGNKRARVSIIPEVHTSHATESSITLEEIENVNDFVDMLERMELPNQMVSSLGDPLLQKYLQLKPSVMTSQRLDQWLLAFFEDQLETLGSEGTIVEMLEAIQDYTDRIKKLPPSCREYILLMVPEWNGITGRQVVLDLLTRIPIEPFEGLCASTLHNLEDAILEDGTLDSKLDLLSFYTHLLQQWILSLLSDSPRPFPPAQAISALTERANQLALTITQLSSSVKTCSTVLDFYESTTSFYLHSELRTKIRIITPPAELVYTLFFTQSLSTLSRLCAVLANYKRAFEFAMALKSAEKQPYSKDYANHFNGFLMDLCNCLWKLRAFNTSDTNAHGCLVPEAAVATLSTYVSSLDTGIEMAALLSLSYSPAICMLAIAYLRELEDAVGNDIEVRHAGPVTQASLKALKRSGGVDQSWGDYRLGVLRYLESKGAPGVGQLMYNSIKNLMSARDIKE